MDIVVEFPSEEIGRYVEFVFADQVPFAQSVAINDTAKDFQKAERDRMEEIFTLRRKQFAFRSVKITHFARKHEGARFAKIEIASPGGRKGIFEKFETEYFKDPYDGGSIAVPTDEVPRTPAGVIQKRWRPRSLFGSGSGASSRVGASGNVVYGRDSTYLIRKSSSYGTIFRYDPSRRGDRGRGIVLYQLVPRVSIDPELEFEKTAQKTVDRVWTPNFLRAFDRAIRTAR